MAPTSALAMSIHGMNLSMPAYPLPLTISPPPPAPPFTPSLPPPLTPPPLLQGCLQVPHDRRLHHPRLHPRRLHLFPDRRQLPVHPGLADQRWVHCLLGPEPAALASMHTLRRPPAQPPACRHAYWMGFELTVQPRHRLRPWDRRLHVARPGVGRPHLFPSGRNPPVPDRLRLHQRK